MAALITVDPENPAININTVIVVIPKNGKNFTLKEAQGHVGGYVEIIQLPDGNMMLMDEEGKLKGKPVNKTASVLAAPVLQLRDQIVGNVLICSPDEFR